MFLRPQNADEAALRRAEEVRKQITDLQSRIAGVASFQDAHPRIELANIHFWYGRYQESLDLVQPLLADEFPENIRMAARQAIGDAHFRHDQYDLANRQYYENLELANRAESEYWAARAKDGIGWVLVEVGHYASGEFVGASQVFDETLPVYEKLGSRIAEAMAMHGMSRAVAGTGDYDLAIAYANRAIDMLVRNGGDDFLQLPLLQLAMVYRDYGAFERSQPLFEQAIDAADRSQDPYSQVTAALGYGCLLEFLHEKEQARALWLATQPIIEECDFPRLGHETNAKMASEAAAREDWKEAYKRQNLSRDYGNRIGVISEVLQNQQMLLRNQIHRSAHLEDALTHLTAGVEASTDGIFVLGAPMADIEVGNYVLHFVNEAAARLLGKRKVDATHVLIREIWKSPSLKTMLDASNEVFGSGIPNSLDPVLLDFPEGGKRWYSAKIVPIESGVAWTLTDVTEREEMQREIVSQRDRLEEANTRLVALDKEKTEMLGMAAHDLRTPIGNIFSITELIPARDEESKKWIGLIRTSSQSMLALIGNLLDVNRIERGELDLDLHPIEIAPLIESVIESFSVRAGLKNIKVDLAPSDPEWVMADDGPLTQVLENLLSNALKFSPPGSQVEFQIFREADEVRIEIRDQGPGISADDQKKLFGKFARLSARPTGGETSTGLGLSIVKRLVEAMDGSAACESEPGKGATFRVTLQAAEPISPA